MWPPRYKGKIFSVFYDVEVRVKHDSFIGGVEHVTMLPITVLPPVLVPVVKQQIPMQPLHMEGLQPDKAELLTDHQQLLIEPQDQSQEPVDPSNLKDKKEEEDIPTGIPDEK